MFLIVVNCVLSDKIEEEDLSGEGCQMLSGEQRQSLALSEAKCLFHTKPINFWHCNKCCMCI